MKVGPCRKTGAFSLLRKLLQVSVKFLLLFTPVSITPLIDMEDACFDLNASRPIAKGDLKWRDALLVAHRVNSNVLSAIILSFHAYFEKYINLCICHSLKLW